MNLSPINCLVSLILLFVATEAGIIIQPKVHVLIYNDLTSQTDLTVHCKSGDDDLGIQVVPYGKDFEFKFRASWLGRTLFYCSMQWDGTTHWFDIYKQRRDYFRCDRCVWNVKPEGPCLSLPDYSICYGWKSQA